MNFIIHFHSPALAYAVRLNEEIIYFFCLAWLLKLFPFSVLLSKYFLTVRLSNMAQRKLIELKILIRREIKFHIQSAF